MPTSTRWCNVSDSFRLEWKPSRWLIAALVSIAALAPLAVLASEMPRSFAWPLAAAAAGYGAWLAWREARKPPRSLDWPVPGASVQWRGPLLFVRSPGLRLSWWPDTLEPGTRRELRASAMAP